MKILKTFLLVAFIFLTANILQVNAASVTGSVTVTVTSVTKYKISVSGDAGCNLSPLGDNMVNSGGSLTVSLSAKSGYTVDSMTTDGVGTSLVSSSVTFSNVTRDHAFSAHCVPVVVDACGSGSGSTPQSSEPTGAFACAKGTLNSSSPVDTVTDWKWSCGTVTSCSAPKMSTMTGSWNWSEECPTCGSSSFTQTQVCTGGNGLCSGTAGQRTCSATIACAPGNTDCVGSWVDFSDECSGSCGGGEGTLLQWFNITTPATGSGLECPAYQQYGSTSCVNNDTCHYQSGSITANACTIFAGNSACNTTVSWNTINPVGNSVITSDVNNSGVYSSNFQIASGNINNGTSVIIPYQYRNLYLYNNGVLLDTKAVYANCASGTIWNGTKCVSNVSPASITSFSADKYSIDFGKAVVLTWTSTGATSCSITATATSVVTPNLPVSSNKSFKPTKTTNYTLNCTGPGGSDSKTLPNPVVVGKINPSYQEY